MHEYISLGMVETTVVGKMDFIVIKIGNQQNVHQLSPGAINK